MIIYPYGVYVKQKTTVWRKRARKKIRRRRGNGGGERTAAKKGAEKNQSGDKEGGESLTGTVRDMQKTEKGGMRQPAWKDLRDDPSLLSERERER